MAMARPLTPGRLYPDQSRACLRTAFSRRRWTSFAVGGGAWVNNSSLAFTMTSGLGVTRGKSLWRPSR
jgi:hypothetical protein